MDLNEELLQAARNIPLVGPDEAARRERHLTPNAHPPKAPGQQAVTKNQTDQPGDPRARLDVGQQAYLTDLVTSWHDAKNNLVKITTGLGADAEAILERLRPGESWTVPGTSVGVRVNSPKRQFSMALAQQALADEDLDQCYARVLDPGLVKAMLKARGLTDQAMAPGTGDGYVSAS